MPAREPALFTGSARTVAPALLGYELSYRTPEGLAAGIIVETEAYLQDDPASHAFKGKTARSAPMFDAAGTLYVYQIYGLHYCLNLVTGPIGQGEAVLIRALEPTKGITLMQQRRKTMDLSALCSGPAKLVQALGISKDLNGLPLFQSALELRAGQNLPTSQIWVTPRIGIRQGSEANLRFLLKDNPFVSGYPRL